MTFDSDWSGWGYDGRNEWKLIIVTVALTVVIVVVFDVTTVVIV
jgi:hypothetical protein